MPVGFARLFSRQDESCLLILLLVVRIPTGGQVATSGLHQRCGVPVLAGFVGIVQELARKCFFHTWIHGLSVSNLDDKGLLSLLQHDTASNPSPYWPPQKFGLTIRPSSSWELLLGCLGRVLALCQSEKLVGTRCTSKKGALRCLV